MSKIFIISACFFSCACDSGYSVKKENDYVVVEKFAPSDSVVYYYSINNNKLLCVEEFFNGKIESLCMDREYTDLETKSKVGDYIYKSYFSSYPGFKMIYQTDIENVIKTGDSRFELFLDSMMQADLGVKLTAVEKQNVFYYISKY